MVDSNAMRTHMTAAMSDASHDSKSLRLRVLRAIGHGHVPVHEHVNFLSRVASHSRDSIIFYALAGLFISGYRACYTAIPRSDSRSYMNLNYDPPWPHGAMAPVARSSPAALEHCTTRVSSETQHTPAARWA